MDSCHFHVDFQHRGPDFSNLRSVYEYIVCFVSFFLWFHTESSRFFAFDISIRILSCNFPYRFYSIILRLIKKISRLRSVHEFFRGFVSCACWFSTARSRYLEFQFSIRVLPWIRVIFLSIRQRQGPVFWVWVQYTNISFGSCHFPVDFPRRMADFLSLSSVYEYFIWIV